MSTRAELPTLPARAPQDARTRQEFSLTGTRPDGAWAAFWADVPGWMRVAAIYLLTRVITTAVMLQFAHNQDETWQTPAQPGYFEFANIWDGEWYRYIASAGYPEDLPRGPDGYVTENTWAFMPVFPFLVRGLMIVTGLPFNTLSVLVSLLAGFGCAIGFYRLLKRFTTENVALFSVFLLCIGPVSPLFQVGYAEALHFWLLTLLLRLLVDRRWLLMMPIVAIASLTRPTGLSWAFALFLIICHRYWQRWRRREAFKREEQVRAWISAVFSGLTGLAWVFIAAIVTHDPAAYLETEFAWRRHFTGDVDTPPFTPWFHGADFWFGTVGMAVVAAVVLFMVVWLSSRVLDRFGIEIRLWGVAYFTYVFAVFFPQSSTFRILFPMFPAAAVLALPRSPLYRVAVSVAAFLAQVAWLYWMWFVIGRDWTPP